MDQLKKVFSIFLFASNPWCSFTQTMHYPFSVANLQATAYQKGEADAFASTYNVSILPASGWHAGVYIEKRFLIEGLTSLEAAFCYSGKNAAAGFKVARTGNLFYQEMQFDAHFTKSLGNVQMGGVFRYHIYSIKGYQRSAIPSIGLATLWKLTDKLYASVQLINPPIGRLSNVPEQEAAEYHFGFNFMPSDQVTVGWETIKKQDYPLQVIAFVYYHPSPQYLFKGGWSSIGPAPFICAYWTVKGLRVGIAVIYHPVLGASPAAVFLYDPKYTDPL